MSTKTVIRAKRELESARLIEIELAKIGKHYSHVIKTVDIWEKNKSFYENRKNGY